MGFCFLYFIIKMIIGDLILPLIFGTLGTLLLLPMVMNTHLHEIVQQAAHILARERVEKNSLTLINAEDEAYIRSQVQKLFEEQDLPVEPSQVERVVGQLVSQKNAKEKDSFEQATSKDTDTSEVYPRISEEMLADFNESEQLDLIAGHLLEYTPRGSQNSLLRQKDMKSLSYLIFGSVFMGLSIIGFSGTEPLILLSSFHGITGALMVGYSRMSYRANKKTANPSTLSPPKGLKFASQLLGIPASAFSNRAYDFYAQTVSGKTKKQFNFGDFIEISKDHQVHKFIELTRIQSHPDTSAALLRWVNSGRPITHFDLMALGLVSTHLASRKALH